MTIKRDPYAERPDRPIVQVDEDRFIIYNPDGSAQPLGTTKEVNLTNPVTADREYQQTKGIITTADGVPILDPAKMPTKRCSACGRLYADTKMVQPCNGCCAGICRACTRTLQDRGAVLALCRTCYKGTFWRRVWVWIVTIFTG